MPEKPKYWIRLITDVDEYEVISTKAKQTIRFYYYVNDGMFDIDEEDIKFGNCELNLKKIFGESLLCKITDCFYHNYDGDSAYFYNEMDNILYVIFLVEEMG